VERGNFRWTTEAFRACASGGSLTVMGLRSWWRRLIAPSWQTPPSYGSAGGGVRVAAGDLCPCGRGHVKQRYSPRYRKDFLGCTAFPACRRAWELNGERLSARARRGPGRRGD
jgi:hypothetical protein